MLRLAGVLTGRLDDRGRGATAVKVRRGRVLVQDPATAVAAGMPGATMATGCVGFVLPLELIRGAGRLAMDPGAGELLRVGHRTVVAARCRGAFPTAPSAATSPTTGRRPISTHPTDQHEVESA